MTYTWRSVVSMQGCAGRYSARCKWAGQAPSTGNRLWPTSETTAIGAHLVTLGWPVWLL